MLTPYAPRLLIDWLRTTPSARSLRVEGTLAFVDISGFTTMTERLARMGKIGAEEVSDALNRTFTELLSVAYDQGAGLVKWGGDAVLLLFDGPEHAARACSAAAGMQRLIRTVGRLTTSAGAARLRMSIGIHSDVFDFFLVGSLHRELLVVGPAATRTVRMEAFAGAGQVAISSNTAALLDPANHGRRNGEIVLLKGRPETDAERSRPVGDTSDIDLGSCFPTPIREHLLARAGDAEHRQITVAFVELSGVDRVLDREGVDAATEALHERISAAQEAVDRYEVTFFETDISPDGTKIMLVAGAPRSVGNDGERMLRAVREIMDAPGRLPLRIGVNSGRVFAGDFGPPYRRTYSVKGDAINTAARIMGKCEPGQVLATEAVLARSRTTFTTTSVGPFQLKGKAKALPAFLLGAVTGSTETVRLDTPLIGREHELEVLRGELRSARGGSGAVVELVGEPGIGKSRIVDELKREAKDLRILHETCEEYDRTTPFLPFRRLMRTLLGIGDDRSRAQQATALAREVDALVPSLAPWLPLIGAVTDVGVPETPETHSLDRRFRKERLETVVVELLCAILDEPTVLVFDDVHWMDDASRDLLARLATAVGKCPVLLVATRREQGTGFTAGAGATTLLLEPLPPDQAAALVQAETDVAPLPPHVVAQLAARSGGNPLFLEELVSAVRSSGLEALPDSLEALLAVQIDRLAPVDRSILRSASVLGRSFSPRLLEATLAAELQDDEIWPRLVDFVVQDSGGEFRFRHALVRDAAYEGLPFRRRLELHRRVGETIERLEDDPSDQSEVLSLHFLNARVFDKAWLYARAAGDRASSVHATVEAAAAYARALGAARRLDDVPQASLAEVYEALGDARQSIGSFVEARAAYRRARALRAGDPIAEAELHLKQAKSFERVSAYRQALRSTSLGLRALEGKRGRAAAAARGRLMTFYAIVRQYQGRPGDAVTWCRRAIAEAERGGDRSTLAHALFVLDWAYVVLGRIDEATQSARALSIYEELGELDGQAVVANGMGAFAYWRGDWDGALELYERSRSLRERLGNPVVAADDTYNIAEILVDRGWLDEAEDLVQDALRVWRAAGARDRIALGRRLLGRIASRSGRPDEGLALLEDALLEYRELGALGEVAETEARIAGSLVRAGKADEGLSLAGKALDQAAAVHVPLLRRVQGFALVQLDDLAAARDAFQASLEAAREQEAAYEVAISLDAILSAEGPGAESGELAPLRAERDVLFAQLGIVHVPEYPTAERREAAAL